MIMDYIFISDMKSESEVDKMEPKLIITNFYEKTADAPLDPQVGIKLVHLTGEDVFSLYGAELLPGITLKPHYHKSGIETYQIIEGKGTMYIGSLEGNDRISWETTIHVQKGDCFTIDEGKVHQLSNPNDESLKVVFGCPSSHMSTDRFVLER